MKKIIFKLSLTTLFLFALALLVAFIYYFFQQQKIAEQTRSKITQHLYPVPLTIELTDSQKTSADLSQDDYLDAIVTFSDDLGGQQIENCRLKIHGNYTATLPKKSLRLKCDERRNNGGGNIGSNSFDRNNSSGEDNIGTTQVLLANYTDKTLLRNFLALEMAEQLPFDYNVDHHQFVDLTFNGEPFGSYLLTDHVGSVAPDALGLDVAASTITEPTFPFLVELNRHLFTEPLPGVSFYTQNNTPFEIKYPAEEDLTSAQISELETYFNQLEDLLLNGDPASFGLYFDYPTAAAMYLLNELIANPDAGNSSIYLSKKPYESLKYGPPWDFDLTFGNYDKPDVAVSPTALPALQNNYYFQQLNTDPAFQAEVRRLYQQVDWSQFVMALETWSTDLAASQQNNFQVWPILDQYVHPNAVVLGDYKLEVDHLQNWLKQRINFLNQHFNQHFRSKPNPFSL